MNLEIFGPAGLTQKIFSFFLPGGLVFFAVFFCVRQGCLDPWLPLADGILPYIVLITGFLLGWRFHRSRIAFVILLLILADRLLYLFGPGGTISTGHEQIIFQVTALLLPLNLAIFYFARERGILNLSGLLRLLFLLAQPFAVFYLLRSRPDIFARLNHRFVELPLLESINMPQVILLINGILLLLFLAGSLFSAKPVMRGFFWALVAVNGALLEINAGKGATIYFSGAGIIVILAVLEAAYAMAYHDELTGLPARRALNTTLQGLGRRYTIAMLDIDFFKKFNDRYGHDVGDQVLCMVAAHIRRVGGGGKAFRYGGEEFTVVFPGKTKQEALPFLEGVRAAIAEAGFVLRNKKKRPRKKTRKRKTKRGAARKQQSVSVTISIGAAEPGKGTRKPTDVIRAADKALYQAKKKGRNCVVG